MLVRSEVVEILENAFAKEGLKFNVPSLLKIMQQQQDGKRPMPVNAPHLRVYRDGKKCFYDSHEVQNYVTETLVFHDPKSKEKHPRISLIVDSSIEEILDDFDDGVEALELANDMTIYTGSIFGNPSTILVANDRAYFVINPTEKDGERSRLKNR